MKLISCILSMLLICSASREASAQLAHSPDTIVISEIKLERFMEKSVLWFADSAFSLADKELAHIPFKDTIPGRLLKKPPLSLVQKDIYLKFALQNTSDTAIILYFNPGFYFSNIQLYKINSINNTADKLEIIIGEPKGFRRITVGPNQAETFIAKLKFVKTTVNYLNPVLVKDYYLTSFIYNNQSSAKDINTITLVFSGILLMMIFYSLAVFSLNRNPEFLYYSGYVFCMATLFFLKSYLYKSSSEFNYVFESYLDFVIQSFGTFIYLAFLRKFINSKKKFPFLHKMFFVEQLLIIASIFIFTYLHFFTNNFVLQDNVENITKYLWIFSTAIFIGYALHISNRLLNYLAMGHSFLLIGGLLSLFMIKSSAGFGTNVPLVFNNALIYYELGLAAELIFFLGALAYKNKNDIIEKTKEGERLNLENERQELEKQLAVFSAKQDERNRISADMHDELGSGVTAIRLMSEIVKVKMKDTTLPEIHRISSSADDLINKMNTIIWTMKSENDSLQSLITYVRIYSLEFFENTMIACSVNIPPRIPNIEVSGEKRRNIFLSVKETLNNVLKHSKAGKVVISFALSEKLFITIADNGVGINLNNLREFGSGLNNVKKRIEGIEGIYLIENNDKGGTRTTFELKL